MPCLPRTDAALVPSIDIQSPVPDSVRVTLLGHLTLVREAYAARLQEVESLTLVGSHAALADLPPVPGQGASPFEVILCSYALSNDDLDGITMIRQLRAHWPGIRILVLTPAATAGLVAMAMGAGANGVVSSERPWSDIVPAIFAVAAGMAPILRDLTTPARLSRRLAGPAESLLILDHPWLTEQEREVLRCCLAGLSVTQTATKLVRSAHTISTQKRSAYNKLHIHSDLQLFALIRGV